MKSICPLNGTDTLLDESTNLLSVLFYAVSSLIIMGCGSSRSSEVIQPAVVPTSKDEGEKNTETRGLLSDIFL